MTELENTAWEGFKIKVRKLITANEILKNQNQDLSLQVVKLEAEILKLQNDKSLLKKQYEDLKIAGLVAASEDEVANAKNKIQKLVREIDKCIALLNK